MIYLVSTAVVEGVSWCKECDYVTFEVVHLTDQLVYGSYLPFSKRSTSELQQSERKTNQSILRSKRVPEIYILSGYVATVSSAEVKMWTCTRYRFRNLNFCQRKLRMNTELPESLLIGSALAEPPEANVLNPPTLPGSFLPRADRGNEPGNVSGVHNIQMGDCVSWVCLCSSTRRSKRAFVANFARRTRKVTLACNWECDYSTVCAAELIGLSSFRKPRNPPRYAIGTSFASQICSGSTFFYRWEVVQIFQRESVFCSKMNFWGSLFITKLVPWEPIWGSIFTLTDAIF